MKPDVLPDETWKPTPGATGLRATIHAHYHPGSLEEDKERAEIGFKTKTLPLGPRKIVIITGAAEIERFRKNGILKYCNTDL